MSSGRSILRNRWLLPLLVLALVPLAELALRATGLGQSRDAFLARAGLVRDNPYFGLLAFPRQLARHAPHFTARTDAGVFRVVVLGESAAMGDPAPAYGMPRQLECQLAARITNQPVEVINAAMTAINSHLIRRIAAGLRRLQPDVVVIYAGNNEVIGPFGPGGVFGRPAPARWVRAQLAIRATRIGQFGARAVDRLAGRESTAHRWHGLALFEQRRLAADDPALATVYRNFDANLRDIVRLAHDAGARVILSTIAVNEQMAPFAARPDPDPERDALAQWNRAREWAAQDRPGSARAAFRRARDLDALRVRADTRINDLIRARHEDGLVRVDADLALGGDPENFIDHVHFTFRGNHRLATLIADAIAPGAVLPEESVARSLAYTPHSEAHILQQMLMRMAQRPYVDQADHRARVAGMHARLGALRPAASDVQTRIDALARARTARPGDPDLALLWGSLLEELRRAPDAVAVYRDILARIPHHTLAHLALGDALTAAGDPASALEHYQLGSPLAANPRAEALAAVGATLADLGRYEEAETYLARALGNAPRHVLAHYNLALLYSRTGRTAKALAAYERLLAIDPGFSEARNNAASLLHRLGRSAEALDALRRITREDPGYLPAWRNLAGVSHALGLTNESAAALAHLKNVAAPGPRERPEQP